MSFAAAELSSTASRARRYRARVRNGSVVLSVEVDVVAVGALLVAAGMIAESEVDDRLALGRGVGALLDMIAGSEGSMRR